MGSQTTSKNYSTSKSGPQFEPETLSIRNQLTPFYSQQGTQQSPWYTPLASAYSNVLGQAAAQNQYQVPQQTQDIISQEVATGMPYSGDISKSPIMTGAESSYRAFVDPELSRINEQQVGSGALRSSDTTRLQSESVGRIGEQMMSQILPLILQDYNQSANRQMQAIPMQEQSQLFPQQALQAAVGTGSMLDQNQYPWLQAITQYGLAGAGGGGAQSSSGYGGVPNFSGGCCFIMLEAGDLTQKVREIRDQLFPPNSYVARGYKKMARWLVPSMRKSNLVKWLVKSTITHPIAKFCETKNLALIPLCICYALVWELYGRV